MGNAYSTHVTKMNPYGILVGKGKGTTQLRGPKSRWVDKVKINVRQMKWDSSGSE
jgi:hypothetical protein